MLRHTLASAAMVALILVTTDLTIGDAGLDPVLAAASDLLDPTAPPVPPGGDNPPLPSSQRPPSDRSALPRIGLPTVPVLPGTGLPEPPGPPGLPPGQRPPSNPSAVGVPSPVPAGVRELFVGDFGTGDFSQWGTCQSVAQNNGCSGYDGSHYSLNLVEGPRGEPAARFVVKGGDVPDFGGGERSEVSSSDPGALTHEGDERWYEFSLRFAEDFPAPSGDWFIVMQWHSGDGSPPLTLEVNGDAELYVGGEGNGQQMIGPVRRGEWVDYALHVGFANSSDGFVEAWENGKQVVARTSRATMSSSENYFKMGIYRGNNDSSTAEVSIAGLRVSER